MKHILFFCILLSGLFLSHSQKLYACSCISQTPAEAYAGFGAIFSARVTGIKGDTLFYNDTFFIERYIVNVSVSKCWKGQVKDEAVIVTSGDGASCGYYFRMDSTYLIYGSAHDTIGVSLCSRTQLIKHAQADLEYLESVSTIQITPGEQPASYRLYPNYPNPFNPSTHIRFDIPHSTKIKISIFNILGMEVTELFRGQLGRGSYTIEWNGKDRNGNSVPAGVYIYQISADNFNQARKMMLLK